MTLEAKVCSKCRLTKLIADHISDYAMSWVSAPVIGLCCGAAIITAMVWVGGAAIARGRRENPFRLNDPV